MADNITLPGAAQVVRTVEIGGIHYQVLILSDSAGNLIGSTLLANGRGQNVVVLNESASKGVDLVGDDLTGQMPVYLGAYAATSLSNATPLTDNKLQALKTSGDGRLLTLPIANPEDQLSSLTIVGANDTASHTLVPVVAADQKAYLWGLGVVNVGAVATGIIILNGATEIGRVPCPIGGHPFVPFPLPLRGSVNVALNYAFMAPPGANAVYMTPLAVRTKV